jgi:type II secretory pathway pseudopilin PulG
MRRHTAYTKRGFTIVEMMVSVSIFIAVLAVSISSLLSLVDANKKAQTLRIAIDNLDLVMEDMSRNIAQARTYHCDITQGTLTSPRDCAAGATSLIIQSNDASIDSIQYRLVEVAPSGPENDYIEKIVQPVVGAPSTFDMTKAEVMKINHLEFKVFGSEPGNNQPRVLISVGGSVGEGTRETAFDVQTTVTQRVPK